jgi:hypothetical protein
MILHQKSSGRTQRSIACKERDQKKAGNYQADKESTGY